MGSILARLAPADQRTLALALISQPPPKHLRNDRPREALKAMFSPPLHEQILAALQDSRKRKHAERYARMLDQWGPDEIPRARELATAVRAAAMAWPAGE